MWCGGSVCNRVYRVEDEYRSSCVRAAAAQQSICRHNSRAGIRQKPIQRQVVDGVCVYEVVVRGGGVDEREERHKSSAKCHVQIPKCRRKRGRRESRKSMYTEKEMSVQRQPSQPPTQAEAGGRQAGRQVRWGSRSPVHESQRAKQ